MDESNFGDEVFRFTGTLIDTYGKRPCSVIIYEYGFYAQYYKGEFDSFDKLIIEIPKDSICEQEEECYIEFKVNYSGESESLLFIVKKIESLRILKAYNDFLRVFQTCSEKEKEDCSNSIVINKVKYFNPQKHQYTLGRLEINDKKLIYTSSKVQIEHSFEQNKEINYQKHHKENITIDNSLTFGLVGDTIEEKNKILNDIKKFFHDHNETVSKTKLELKKNKIIAQLEFREKINEYVELLGNNNLILNLTTNFLNDIPKNIFTNSKYFISFEKLIINNLIAKQCMFSTKEQRDKIDDSNYFIQNFKQEYFDIFCKIIMKRFTFMDEKHAVFSIWRLLNKEIQKWFSIDWSKEYGQYFSNIQSMTLMDCITSYCRNETIIPDDNHTLGRFTYYLMKNKKFDDKYLDTDNFLECSDYVKPLIVDGINNKKIEDFEKRISKPPDYIKYTIDNIDLMDGSEFEQFVFKMFHKMGYSCIMTKTSGDQGIDVIAEKNGRKFGIQAKCYSNAVSNSAIQEVVAGITHYKLDKGIVVTNNLFTKSARELAESNNIILWDRNVLKQKLLELF